MDSQNPAVPPKLDAPVAGHGRPQKRTRLIIAAGVLLFATAAYFGHEILGTRGAAAIGFVCFLGIAAACSSNLAAINWQTIAWGITLQVVLALLMIKVEIGGVRPGEAVLRWCAGAIEQFLRFTNKGTEFVFGPLADPQAMTDAFGKPAFVFAFSALPPIIFISAFFSLLHHWGIIQRLVALCAKLMKRLMQTSGAETLSAIENVFMGQSEAPLIVRPYIPTMTRSELLALMTGGMATLSGGLIAVYIGMGVDPVAVLATSIMSAPCGLYLAKLMLPEMEVSQTAAHAAPQSGRQHVNSLDAIAYGASTGAKLAFEIAAMLIAFLALIAMADYLLGLISSDLSLSRIFGWIFRPLAALIGVPAEDWTAAADLLGTKIVTNEFVAYASLTSDYQSAISPRTFTLATYALGGFANFGSIGIQLGALGALAPNRRQDLAQLGLRALLAGYLVTLMNASIAAMLL
jgi:CNT family concentrative nucleoside transporter